ncbi:hypothetical protein [Streptosporangium sp. NPDC000396]|uniref:hypothetical protein n=1 Tax=Streptosporangium sp. NPDC000396 TaxID=3366185 RepID=UPI0036A27A56
MQIDEAIRHYRNLLDQTWMGEGMAWTVIIADDKPIELHEIATSLSGGAPPEVWEDTPRMATDRINSINYFIPVKSEYRINLIEPGLPHTNYSEFIQWMSAGRRLWSASWHTKGGEQLIYVENGEVLFRIGEYFNVHMPFGTSITAAQRELEIMRQPSLSESKAAALAIMELHGGFRLNLEWLDSPGPVIAVDQPIPAGATPPSAFASAEPKLATHLRQASPTARRSFLIHLTERLADRYDLRIPEVTAVLDQMCSGQRPTPAEWRDLASETMYLAQDHWFGSPADAEPAWLRWQAAIAIRHALRSLDTGAENVEALLSARNALHSEWESLRDEILALPQ